MLGGKLVFDYANHASPASSVLSILDASYGDGSNPFSLANGATIYSSTAKDAGMALGWADDGGSKVTVMYTLYGDATLEARLARRLGRPGLANYTRAGTWSLGDFNYDGYGELQRPGHFDRRTTTTHLSQPSLALSGADSVNDGLTYTLTLGEVTGITVQSYVIDWGDGASPEVYTAAEIEALNRQVTYTYTTGVHQPNNHGGFD